MNDLPTYVLFVCLGNICRSSMAEGILRQRAQEHGLEPHLRVASAGTGSWHIGNPPDKRAQKLALRRGVDITRQKARQFNAGDFARYDYILAMDRQNLADVSAIADLSYGGTLKLFLDFAPGLEGFEVPDPYYGGEDGFAQVFDLLDAGCAGLIRHLKKTNQS